MTEASSEDKRAYLKAQKQRNLFIGLALAAFVVIVFFVSMSRMAQGLKHDNGDIAASASAES
jgi:hypothetical protein